MVSLDENEGLVVDVFRNGLGFEIEKIPEAKERTADFLLSDGANSYLVEVKTRYRSEDEIKTREAQFEESGLAELSRAIERRSSVSKLISEALTQIESTSVEISSFRVIFFLLRNFDVDERMHNILANLFGIKTVVDWGSGNTGRDCYYFTESDFFRYRDRLDAVIVMKESNGKGVLCLNDYSPNIDALRTSPLAASLAPGVRDPARMEADGQIWLADCGIDRSNENAVIQFLKEKYGLSDRTTSMPMNYVSATVIEPK